MNTFLIVAASVFVIYSFLAIFIPAGGSVIIVSILAIFIEPHKAIGLMVFYFFINGIIASYIFRKHIDYKYFKKLIIPSIIGAIIGAFILVNVNKNLLLSVVIISAVYFLLKKIRQMLIKQKNKSGKKWGFGEIYTGLVSGVVQGAGLPGGGMRNSYLLSEGLTLAEMNGTTNFIGIFITIITTYSLITEKFLSFSDFNIFIWIFPLMIFTTWLSRYVILKVNEKYMDWLVIYSMVGIVVFLILRFFGVI